MTGGQRRESCNHGTWTTLHFHDLRLTHDPHVLLLLRLKKEEELPTPEASRIKKGCEHQKKRKLLRKKKQKNKKKSRGQDLVW